MDYSRQSRTKPFGKWLRHARQEQDLPIRAVAAAAEMDQAALSKVELGQRLLTEEQMSKIAKLLGIDETLAVGRLLAEKFIQKNKDRPAAVQKAIDILADQAPEYRPSRKR